MDRPAEAGVNTSVFPLFANQARPR